ncbi:MAG TPA: anti-sigma factor [Acidimicrobiales bacterium]|jgi:hypothetical protein|nr:anti-sigma factor [Acidimicrobiales bacterium]
MGRVTTHAHLEELLGAYALDALEPDESALLGRHLAACPRCRAEVAEHREVAGLLGYVGGEAPGEVWERIAANLEDAPPAVQLDRVPGTAPVVSIASARRRTGGRVVVAVGAAVAAGVIAILGVQVANLDHRTNDLLHSAVPTMTSVRAALAEHGALHVALQAPTGGPPLASAVIEPDGSGYLYGSNLRALPPSETYQLWGLVGSQRISYGVLGASPGIQEFRAGGRVDALAITSEVASGGAASSKAPVAIGPLPSTT